MFFYGSNHALQGFRPEPFLAFKAFFKLFAKELELCKRCGKVDEFVQRQEYVCRQHAGKRQRNVAFVAADERNIQQVLQGRMHDMFQRNAAYAECHGIQQADAPVQVAFLVGVIPPFCIEQAFQQPA